MSNRFLPDTWLDAVNLPAAMLQFSPVVYFESSAPDGRLLFSIVAILACLLGLMWKKRRKNNSNNEPPPQLVLALTGAVTLGVIAWLWISGNARYGLILMMLAPFVGVMALRWLVPQSSLLALSAAGLLCVLQIHFLWASKPQLGWSPPTSTRWHAAKADHYPPGAVNVYRAQAEDNLVVVVSAKTLTAMSLQYQVFGPRAHYVSLQGLTFFPENSQERRRAEDLLARAHVIYLVDPLENFRVRPQDEMAHGLITKISQQSIPPRLAQFGLKIDDAKSCVLLPERLGFRLNICLLSLMPASKPEVAPEVAQKIPKALILLKQLQTQCPRIFGGEAVPWIRSTGALGANVGDHKYSITITPELDVYVESLLDVLPRKILNGSQAANVSNMSCAEIIRAGRQYWWASK